MSTTCLDYFTTPWNTGSPIFRVFRMGTSYLKDPGFYESLGVSDTLITTTNVHKHKEFLHIMSPIFSQRYIDRFSPRIAEGVEIIASRLREAYVTGTPTDIQRLFRCLTVNHSWRKSGPLLSSFDRLMSFVRSSSGGPTGWSKTRANTQISCRFSTCQWRTYGSVGCTEFNTFSLSNLSTAVRHFPFLTRVAMGLPACMARKLAPGYVRCREVYHDRTLWMRMLMI